MSNPQQLAFEQFMDCLKRTKKKPTRYASTGFHNTGDLFYTVIEQSSVLCDKGAHSYREVCNAVSVFKEFLCPGQWCFRRNCKNHSTSHAWGCNTTRPAACKEFEAYVTKKIKKEHKGFKEGDDAVNELIDIGNGKCKYDTRSGMYFDESMKKFVCYERTDKDFFAELHGKKIDALMFFIKHNRVVNYDFKQQIFNSLQKIIDSGGKEQINNQ
jgi:hypothetical protein